MSVTFELDGQEIRPRVEPDHELGALPLDRFGQTVGEVRRRDGSHTVRLLRPKDDEGRVDRGLRQFYERLGTKRRPRRLLRPP